MCFAWTFDGVSCLTGNVLRRMPDEVDSSDDDVLPNLSSFMHVSNALTMDTSTAGMRRPGAPLTSPDIGSFAWTPMSSDEFSASRGSVYPAPHFAQPLSVSSDFDSQHSTDSELSSDDDSNVADDAHSSSAFPSGANPLDYLSRGTLVFPAIFFTWLICFVCYVSFHI